MEKYVRISFVIGGLLVWVTLAALFSAAFQFVNPNWDRLLLGARFAVSDLLGLIGGMAVAVILVFHERANRLGLEVANELRNVTWPTWPETRVSTVVVVATTIVVSVILGLFDALGGLVTGAIYKI